MCYKQLSKQVTSLFLSSTFLELKLPKPGIPLRPIVSFGNSPTYAISGYLARILSPVVGNTDYTDKNSCEFT